MEKVQYNEKGGKDILSFNALHPDSFLDGIAESALRSLIITDQRGLIMRVNDASLAFTNYSRQDLLNCHYQVLIPYHERARIFKAVSLLSYDNPQIKGNLSIQTKDGHHHFTTSYARLMSVCGQNYILWNMEEADVDKEMLQNLLLGSRRQSSLIDNLSIYLWSLDENLCFVTANKAAKAIFKKSFDYDFEAGDFVMQLYHKRSETDTDLWLKKYKEVLESGESRSFELAENFYGRFSHISVELHPIKTQNIVKGISCLVKNDTNDYLKNRLNEALSNFKSKVLNVNSISDLLWAITDEVIAKLHLEDAVILMKKGNLLQIRSAYGSKRVGPRRIDSPLSIEIGKGVTGSVAKTGIPEIINDVRHESRYFEVHFHAGSEIVVPIKMEGEVIGVINCESSHINFFKPIHLEILTEVAEVTAEKIGRIISDRRLRKMEEQNRAVLNSTPNSYLLLTPRYNIESFNRTAFKSFLPLKGELKKGENIFKYVPAEYREEFKECFSAALNGTLITVNKKFSFPGAEDMWIKVTFSPAINTTESIFGVTLIMENITQHINDERLILLQNQELRKTNQELDKFVYSVSHDLRSPVSSVMGISSLIKMSDQVEEIQEYNELIVESMERMDNFIRNILDYSRNSRVDLEYEDVNAHELLEDILADHSYVDGFKNIEIRKEINVNEMKVDRQRMGIILRNLMSNAVKYHDVNKSNRYIKVSLNKIRNRYELVVSDNGQGIDNKYLPELFNMFFTANRRSKGSGIGLYIVKEAAAALNGEIFVASKLNIGTTFKVIVPVPQKGLNP